MKRNTLILTGVLAVQLALALVLTLGSSGNDAFKAEEPLLAFDKDKVDQIAIDRTGGNSVTLKKQDGKWVIPAMADFPASKKAVSGLLDKLADLKKGWPVATTSDAAERFKVTGKSHERRVVLKSGKNELGTLFIGTAPTYRKVNVRPADDSEIYSVTLAAYDAGARGEDWMDRDFLDIAQDKISSLSIGDITIEHKDGKFTLAGLKPGETLKSSEIPPIVSAVASPSFDVVQGKGKDALAKLEPADFEVTVKRKDADPIIYKFKKEAAGGAYLFASSAHPYVFRVAEATIKPIVEAKRDKLVEVKADEKPKEETGQPKVSDQQQSPPASGGPGG